MAQTSTDYLYESPGAENKVEMKSKTIRELTKCLLVYIPWSFYIGIMSFSSVSRAFADTISHTVIYTSNAVVETRTGAEVDQALSTAISTINLWISRLQDACPVLGHLSTLQILNLWFRYCPPLLLFRWWIDLTLLGTEFALALVKDLVRLDPNRHEGTILKNPSETAVAPKLPQFNGKSNSDAKATPEELSTRKSAERKQGAEEMEETEHQMDDKNGESTDPMVLRPRKKQSVDDPPSGWRRLLSFTLLLVYTIFKSIAIYIIIPFLSAQFFLLDTCSDIMHCLAGLEIREDFDDVVDKDGLLDRQMLGSNEIPVGVSKRKWLTDSVLDRAARSLNQFSLGEMLLSAVGIRRPITWSRKLHKMAIKRFDSWRFGKLASYLQLNSTYNEHDDPDFVPSESSSDDSTSSESGEKDESAINIEDDTLGNLNGRGNQRKPVYDKISKNPDQERDDASTQKRGAEPKGLQTHSNPRAGQSPTVPSYTDKQYTMISNGSGLVHFVELDCKEHSESKENMSETARKHKSRVKFDLLKKHVRVSEPSTASLKDSDRTESYTGDGSVSTSGGQKSTVRGVDRKVKSSCLDKGSPNVGTNGHERPEAFLKLDEPETKVIEDTADIDGDVDMLSASSKSVSSDDNADECSNQICKENAPEDTKSSSDNPGQDYGELNSSTNVDTGDATNKKLS